MGSLWLPTLSFAGCLKQRLLERAEFYGYKISWIEVKIIFS